MKPLFKLMVSAAAIALLACTAVPPAKPKKERTVAEKAPVLTTETVSLPDGTRNTIRKLSYDRSFAALIKEELIDAATNEIQETTSYIYNDSRLSEKSLMDGKNRLKNKKTYAYTAEGLVETESTYDHRETLQAISRYSYDQKGRKTEWTTLDSGRGLLASTRYVYQGDFLGKISLLGSGGKVELEINIEYDAHGRKTAEIYKSAIGVVEKQNVFFYDLAGRLLEEQNLSSAKALLNKNIYRYAVDSGAQVEIRRYDARGDLKEIVNREYYLYE